MAQFARLAVDLSEQGAGHGGVLLKDALLRAACAARKIGARAMLAHAKDEAACSFYAHHDFESSPTDELHIHVRFADVGLE